MSEGIAKPRTTIVTQFWNFKCVVVLDVRQKWKYKIKHNGYEVSRDNVTIQLTKKEFNDTFVIK